jgi:diadenosine tetraphosphatase ApaH/serine/threonine PP2A family protein phosphatase
MCAYQGLRPWLRSLALRAKRGDVQCAPTRDFVPGYVRSPSGRRQKLVFIVYQGLRPWQRSSALRAGTGVVQCAPTRDFVPGYVRSPSGRRQSWFLLSTRDWPLATLVSPPGEKRRCSMSAYQGLRPWLRSLALRAEQKLFIVYQGLRPWRHSLALRAERGDVQCPPTRDFVPGYVRAPSGRRQSWFLLSTRDCVPGNELFVVRPARRN